MRDRIFAVSISYNTKNADKRFDLKRKIHVLYIGTAVLFAAFFNAMLLQLLPLKQEKQDQQNIESRLPTGDYLPDSKNPLISGDSACRGEVICGMRTRYKE